MNITIPDNFRIPLTITSIASRAFQSAKIPENFKIPESVTLIEEAAFNRALICKGLSLPNSITTINQGTFLIQNSLELFLFHHRLQKLKIKLFSYVNYQLILLFQKELL